MDELSWIVSTSGETKVQNFDPHGRIEFQDGPFTGFIERIEVRPGIALYRLEGVSTHAWQMKAQGEAPAGNLVVGTMLDGAGIIDAKGNERQVWRGPGRSYVLSLAEREITYRVEGGVPWRAVTLLLEPEALERLGSQNGSLPTWARAVLDDGRLPISSVFEHDRAVMRAAQEILLSPYRGSMETLWRESKALEFLARQLDHPGTSRPPALSLNPRDLAKVEEAYGLLLANLREPPTLELLAAQVRIPPRRLNQGFRQLYGMTVFEALLEARMKTAHTMILERQDIPLKHLAWLVGYNQLSNFINAYRRRFGVSPGMQRRIET